MKEIIVKAVPENLEVITEFINDALESMDAPMKAQFQIDVAVDEIFSNISNYAYAPDTGEATVRVEEQQDPHAVVITFLDRGVPFDPLSAPTPDVSLGLEEREVGGLGIFMVRKSMDAMHYEYQDGQNLLTLVKFLP